MGEDFITALEAAAKTLDDQKPEDFAAAAAAAAGKVWDDESQIERVLQMTLNVAEIMVAKTLWAAADKAIRAAEKMKRRILELRDSGRPRVVREFNALRREVLKC